MILKKKITAAFKELQSTICKSLENEDGKAKFQEDSWERPGGGGGISRIIELGKLVEKGGVNFSAVYGAIPEKLKDTLGPETKSFYATGVSIVLHPVNPYVPIIHMNIRYFETNDGMWWFGGGIDLTPHYVDVQQASFFHKALKEVCERHHDDYYPKFKSWADNYFFVKHRNETRGIGGIFFDRLNQGGSKEELFGFTLDIGKSFIPIYSHLSGSNRDKAYGEQEKQWQLIRRGRYVEFNLVLDRGTKFGLETNGRIESILMSLPPLASWKYNYHPEPNSPEQFTLDYLKKDIDWIKIKTHD